MKNDLFFSVGQAVKYWWSSIIIGVLTLGLGVWCFITPWATIETLAIVFAFAFFVSGIFEIIFSVSNRNTLKGWGWTLTVGIIDLIFGMFLTSMPPFEIAWVLAYFVGFWIMFQSLWALGNAFDLQRSNVSGSGWLIFLAVLGIILSFIFLFSPVMTEEFIYLTVCFAFVFYGIYRVYLGIKLRTVHKELEAIEK